jgi:hypothetical protein
MTGYKPMYDIKPVCVISLSKNKEFQKDIHRALKLRINAECAERDFMEYDSDGNQLWISDLLGGNYVGLKINE